MGAGFGGCAFANQSVEQALFGGGFGARGDLFTKARPGQGNRDLNQIAHDALDIPPDVADLGKLGCLDLYERRVCELGEAACDFGFAATGRPDHQNVFRLHLFTQRFL